MGCQIRFATDDGERVVDLDDLPPEVFERIAAEDPERDPWRVYSAPGWSVERACAVLDACTDHLRIERIERPSTDDERDALLTMFGGG